jgi:hypothetical protein
MTSAVHLDPIALDRDITRSGLQTLCELVYEDPVPVAMKCDHCGVTSLVPAGLCRINRASFLEVFFAMHRRCGGKVK